MIKYKSPRIYIEDCNIYISHKYVLKSSISIMSSESDYHSSSSRSPKKKDQHERSRSRERKHHDRTETKEKKIKFKIPELSGPLIPFKHFCNMQDNKMSNQTIQKGYDKYRKDWEQKQNEEFMNLYKKDAWFSQRYDPEVLDLLERDRKQNCRRNHIDFLTKFDAGHFDKIDFRVKDPAHLGVVAQLDEDQENNLNNSFIISQTIEVHMNPSIDVTKQPYFGYDQDISTLFIKSVPRTISRYDIRAVVEKLEGYRGLTMSDPVKKMNLTRYCWIQFDTEENCNKAVLAMSGLIIKDQVLAVTKSVTKIKRIKILKNYPSSRIVADISSIIKLIDVLDNEVGIQNNDLLTKNFDSNQIKFDTLLLYLRKVHSFDYFTTTMFQNQRILSLKVGSAFLRMQADYQQIATIQTVFKKIQENTEKRIIKGNQTPEYMSLVRDEIQKFIRETQKLQKDQQKQAWKCLYCDKKFKTCEFLSKHMIVKHQEIKMKKIQVIMEQLYLKDPQKITFISLIDSRDPKGRRTFKGGFQREKRRQMYRDFDEPEGEKTQKVITKPMINFLDI